MKKTTFFILFLLATRSYGYVATELFVWKLREGSAENWAQTISAAGRTQTVELHAAPFRWDPGFRVEIGKQSSDTVWDISATYTHYETAASRSVSATSGGVYSPYVSNFFVGNVDGTNFGPNYRNASIDWQFAFNTLDLAIGYTADVDAVLLLRSWIGLKSAIINQTFQSIWQTPTTPTTFNSGTNTLKNNFWGVGPSLGLDSTWPVFYSTKWAVNLFGNLSGALLSGRWAFEENYLNNTPTSVTVYSDDIRGATTMAMGTIGIESTGHMKNVEVTFQLGYEAQVWFNQMQYYNYNMGKLNHLMSLQGAMLTIYANF